MPYIILKSKVEDVILEFKINSFTKKYIKNLLGRITGFIEEQTGVASNFVLTWHEIKIHSK